MVQAKFGLETVSRRTGEITSSHSIRPTGSATGTEVVITGGMDTAAVLLTARGASSTSESIHGGRTGIHTITMRTVTIPMNTIPAFTKATAPIITGRATTIRRNNTRIP